MPERKMVITLSVPDFLDAVCQGCVGHIMGRPANPTMHCNYRHDGEYCPRALDIGMIICRRTSLENLTNFEDTL